MCVCDPRLTKFTHQCTITNGIGKITRESHQHFWAGYDNQSHELILHPQCPFDYCVSHDVVFPLNDGNLQCAHHRSGLLCGACKGNFSLVLGTSHCKQCTNNHLILLVPFALMGVGLVFLLLVCKLTVATGTLSGLASVLCQHCWTKSNPLSTSGIYWCFLNFHFMAKPWLWYWNMLLWWNGCLQ